MSRNSAKTVLLTDTSKVGRKYTYKGFGFEEIDYVIMEEDPQDPKLKKVLGKKLVMVK